MSMSSLVKYLLSAAVIVITHSRSISKNEWEYQGQPFVMKGVPLELNTLNDDNL